ncbi:MAG TPA: hypothetical protein VM840_06625 [Actinomycetota bacterium]|nr:hypothetical protein [Actinomycetota bacterium]
MYGRAPTAQGFERSFWTKRKKSATSLLATLAMLAGIAIAYKLFDQTVPNNVVRDASNFDFLIERNDPRFDESGTWVTATSTGSAPIFRTFGTADEYQSASIYPGDTRQVNVRISNTHVTPSRDASFQVYIQNIEVHDRTNPGAPSGTCPTTGPTAASSPCTVSASDPRWARFVSWFTFAVDKERIYNSAPLGGDLGYDPRGPQYAQACSSGVREVTRNSPCELGLIRAKGSTSELDDKPTDVRLYRFKLTEADDGTDQSGFKGWAIKFDLVFSARVPAVPEDVTPIGQR